MLQWKYCHEEATMRCKKCGKEYPSEYYFKAASICSQCWERMTPEEQIAVRRQVQRLPTSTTFDIVGHWIKENLGVVRGITVRSRSIFGTIGGSLQTLVGGNITLFTELCEKTRAEAFDMMIQHAMEMGANAVVGIRYDATEVMQGVTEVLCYGTAVVVERMES
jgi:uncharacterized protein YbjQ (UPF0145 family)